MIRDYAWRDRAIFAALGVILGVLVSNFPSYYELYKRWFKEPLSVSLSAWSTERVFYRVVNDYAIPVQAQVYVRVTNNGEHPITLRAYAVSVRSRRKWQRLIPLRFPAEEEGCIVTFWRDQAVMRMRLHEEGFDFKARRQGLEPGNTISGWIFFESAPSENVETFKFEFLDSAGETHTLELKVDLPKREGTAQLGSAPIPLGPAEPIPSFLQQYLRQSPQ